jgi:hypothetical protein
VAARLPSYGLVGVSLQLLQAHTCVRQLASTPNHSCPSDNPNVATPLKAFFAQHPLARHLPFALLESAWSISFFLAGTYKAALLHRLLVASLLTGLGMLRNPKTGIWTPTQVGDHLGLAVDLERGEFRAPHDKLRGDLEWWLTVPD